MYIVFVCTELGLCTVYLLIVYGAVVVLLLVPYATCMIYGFCRIGMRYGTAEARYILSILL